MKSLIARTFVLVWFTAVTAWPHGGGEEVSASVGPGMAVTEADATKGFRLSEAAWKRLGIETRAVDNGSALNVPKESWVHFREEYGIYRCRDGWFKLVPREAAHFQKGDQVAVKGAPLLRVTELDLFGANEEKEDEHDEHKDAERHHDQ